MSLPATPVSTITYNYLVTIWTGRKSANKQNPEFLYMIVSHKNWLFLRNPLYIIKFLRQVPRWVEVRGICRGGGGLYGEASYILSCLWHNSDVLYNHHIDWWLSTYYEICITWSITAYKCRTFCTIWLIHLPSNPARRLIFNWELS